MGTKRERVMIAVFETADDARRTIEDLRGARFSDRKIGVLTHDKEGDPAVTSFKSLEGNEAGPGAVIGAAAGAGGGALWALAVAAGVLPAIGPIIAGGLLLALAAGTATGVAAGVLVGALVGLGVSNEEAAYLDAEFRSGHTILVVQPDDRAQLVATIFAAHHARNGQIVTPTTLASQIEQRHL